MYTHNIYHTTKKKKYINITIELRLNEKMSFVKFESVFSILMNPNGC